MEKKYKIECCRLRRSRHGAELNVLDVANHARLPVRADAEKRLASAGGLR